MPAAPTQHAELIHRLDARHEELIQKLDELNAQIEAALAEFARSREPGEAGDSTRCAA